MKNKTTLKLFSLLFFISLGLWSCVDNDDHELPNLDLNCVSDDANETISSIQSLVKDFSGNHEITENIILSGYVISSDVGGNFYQQIIIQDNKFPEFNGIEVSAAIKGYNDFFPIGARVKVFAKGLFIAKDRGVIKLGVKDSKYPVGRIPEKEVFNHLKFYCNKELVDPAPKVYTDIRQALQDGNVNTLIRLENVYFPTANGEKTFVEKGEKATNISIKDENGNTLDLRNSSFVKWADNIIPRGKGNITLILSKYNDSYQAFINNLSDIDITDNPDFTPTTQNIPVLEASNASENDYQLNKKVRLHGFIKLINGKFSSIELGDNTSIQIQAKKGLWNTLPQDFKDKMSKEGQEVTVTGTFSDYTLKDKKVIKAIVYETENDVEFGNTTAPSTPTNPAPDPTPTPPSAENANLIDFETITETSNTYNTAGTINGKDGVIVTFMGRTDMDKYAIDGKGIMIKDNSYVKITFPQGVKTITIDYRSAYSSKNNRELKIIEGDENSQNIIRTETFPPSDEIHKLELSPNATESYTLTLKAGNKQIVIDNIKWTN